MNQPDLPTWAYWCLGPVVVVLLILYVCISAEYRPRSDRENKKRKYSKYK